MNKYKIKVSKLIILIALFVNYAMIPFLGMEFNDSNNYNVNYSNKINTDSLSSTLTTPNNNIDEYLDLYNKDTVSKYDDNLKEYLINLNSNHIVNSENVKIIVQFIDSVNKGERTGILDETFDDYTLLSNYDIISGAYLKIDPAQLISNEELVNGIQEIKKIYKSQVYQNPYISDNTLETSALYSADYPNWWISAIGAENLAYDGTGVKVAVIDTGVYDHPDLNIINNSNFVTDESIFDYSDDVGHGTHVAGIIGSDGGLNGEYVGVAPGALIINARAGNASGLLEGDVVKAIEWSSKPTKSGGAGADIISMSFGGGYPIISDSITQAITNAKKNYGVIFVASAGNSGPDYFTGSTPASGIDVISVGATNEDDELASFSSWGPTFRYLGYPDVVAPGVNIISTEAINSIISNEERLIGNYFNFASDADYIPLSGTSMSCPMVAGALAILLDAFPNITPETARIALLEGSRTLNNDKDHDILKSGAGLINVTASLNYLSTINPDVNDIAKINPSKLPIEPYDLLNFPGDHQKFNLTLISGKNNTFDLEVPNNIQGIKLSLDKTTVVFDQSGIEFLELDIELKKDANPGIRDFQINLTIGAQIYDIVQISLEIKLPERRILMESYHGLNDWFPNITSYNDVKFYQLGFYEAIQDLSEMNISVDYYMEHWTPDYNKDINNSILTEERLAQYDAVILQTPILPYSALEMENINNYFQNGGNMLFLGTKYQYMALDNINYLFSKLNISIQVNEENIMDVNWLGLGATVDSQNVNNFNNNDIFMDVSKFYWLYGNTFTVSNDAESIASIDSKTVAAMYNGTSQNIGNLLVFGDLHWMYTNYDSSSYEQDHSKLLKNVFEFLLPTEEAAITIDLQEESSSKSTIDLTVYLKNQTINSPITTYDSLNVLIKNSTFSSSIILNTTHSDKGIYFNNTFKIPFPSYSPYTIELNLTIGSTVYRKITKILYFDHSKMPKIESLTSSDDAISRSITSNTNLIAELDDPSYGTINGYMSIYTYSFYNTKKTVNKTLTFTHSASNIYTSNFNPDTNDPSGYAIYYITPANSNYTNPKSPRYVFEIINYAPEIVKTASTFNFGGYGNILFDDTESDEGSFVYSTSQGEIFNFEVDVEDGVSYEDEDSEMRLFVNFFTCSVTEDGYIILIFPQTFEVVELDYSLDNFEGSFTIPYTMLYSSISGDVSRSTAANFNVDTNQGYLSILYLTLYDSEGGSDEFIIILMISAPPTDYSFIVIIVISIIALIGVVGIFVYFARRKRYPKTTKYQPYYEEYTYQPYYEEKEEGYVTPKAVPPLGPSVYCPFCGGFISTPKKFCPHCGESLEFIQE